MKKIVVALGVIVVLFLAAIIISTKGTIFTGGVPLGGVTFSEGSIPNVPVYPEAEQSTVYAGVHIPDDMRRVVPDVEQQWKHYLTDDSMDKVIEWYGQQMDAAGLEKGQPRDSGVQIYHREGRRYALFVSTLGGKTSIILATGKVVD